VDFPHVSYLVRYGKNDEFDSLVDTIDDINQVNDFGQNLLHAAVASNNHHVADVLLSKNININQQDYEGLTPLHYAATYSNARMAEKVIKAGGDLKIVDQNGNSPLWAGVFNAKGDYGVVDLLIRNSADPHQKNKHGLSPLDFAKRTGDPALVKRLDG
jgi:ankyrin repeat protein